MKILIIPAAGQASRLRPLSNSMSKTMVPVAGKPVIGHVIKLCKKDFDVIVIVDGSNNDIRNYIESNEMFSDTNIHFAKQEKSLGPLHAIHIGMEKAKTLIKSKDNELTVWLGDTLAQSNENLFSTDSLVVHPVKDWERWCLVDDNIALYDKPTNKPPTDKAIIGIYNFSDFELAEQITKNVIELNELIKNEFQISSLLTRYNKENNLSLITITDGWYDFGDLSSLYISSARLLEQSSLTRPGCEITIDCFSGTLTKTGKRCKNEMLWYEEVVKHIPSISPFIPQIHNIDKNECSYEMDYLPGAPVSDILLYEKLSDSSIEFIISKAISVYFKSGLGLSTNKIDEMFKPDCAYMWYNKCLDRVLSYEYDWITDKEMFLFIKYIKKYSSLAIDNLKFSVIHGDYHLGNILFNPATGKMIMIDPRGQWGSTKHTVYGDMNYDMAKIAQSIIGEYIWIYDGIETNKRIYDIALRTLKESFKKYKINFEFVKQIMPILLGSCLDFHKDDEWRQQRIWKKTMELIE